MFETQIAKGIALLDAKMPGWETQVDLASLRMSNCDSCVLGQLTGAYYSKEAAGWLNAARFDNQHEDRAGNHGFSIRGGYTAFELDAHYTQLTAEWREAIARKRVGDVK